ncbi:hypothetical protein [Mycobacterium sp. SMC-15]|uniref:hypothetical protein n=1 Tax=Mycobacterium sp. SMC-15 TaxID=3381627 RepID=UPI0038775095
MVSPNAAQTALVIPSDAPHAKFVRYAHAVAKEYQPLFPITPATRPLTVGLDLRTLGPRPADYEDLIHVLRRDVVTPMLMVFDDDDADLVTAWKETCEVEEHYVIHYTGPQGADRFLDSVEFTVSTMHGEQRRGWRKCHFFDIHALLDAQNTTATDLSADERIRAAVRASAGYGLGTDVIVSLARSVGRADVGDNDIVTSVTPDDLHPIFGHYLRMTGNRIVAEYRSGGPSIGVTRKMEPPSVREVYDIGLASLLGWLDMFRIVAFQLGDVQALAEIDTIRTRIRRAARALDEVIAGLSRTNGHDAAPTADTIEFVSEAFDREMLYLMAVFDGYGRAFVRWLDPTSTRDLRKSLHSAKTLDDYVGPNYAGAPQLTRLRELQRFAFACSQLRNRIHDAVLPTGAFTNRTYGNSQAIAIDLSQTDVELTQELVDRLGVWQATPPNAIWGHPTTVAEVATTAVELFKASLEYIDLFTHLIMCTKPAGAPNAIDLLGKVTDNGYRPPEPHPVEALYRQLFRWE